MTADEWIILGVAAAVSLLFHWLPLWRRESLWFGVTTGPEFGASPAGKRVLARYRVEIWICSAIALALIWWGMQRHVSWALVAGLTLQSLGAFAAFARGHSRTRPFAQTPDGTRSASLAAAAEGLPGGAAALIIPYAVLAATVAFLHANWQRLPIRFPTHWGFSGEPDAWAVRNWRGVDGPLIGGALIIALLHALGYMIVAGSPRSRTPEGAEWTIRFRQANLRLVVAMGLLLSLLFSAIGLNPLFSPGGELAIPVWAMLAAVLAITVIFIWPIVRISQEPGSGSDGTPDECWKLGQIYFNPNDPALMVQKRFGVGYTINFGNRASWLVLGLIVLIVMVPVLLG